MARRTHKEINSEGRVQDCVVAGLKLPKDLYQYLQNEGKKMAEVNGHPRRPFRVTEVILAILRSHHKKAVLLSLQITPDD